MGDQEKLDCFGDLYSRCRNDDDCSDLSAREALKHFIECSANESCQPDYVVRGWTRMCFDSGCGGSIAPKGMSAIGTSIQSPGEPTHNFKIANGSYVPSLGNHRFRAVAEDGIPRTFTASVADVHKPLISAGQLLAKGHIAIMDGDGGLIVPESTAFGKEMRAAYERLLAKYGTSGAITLYKERGVYNYYLKMKETGPRGSGQTSVPTRHP